MNYKNYKIEHLSSDRLWIGHYPCGDADGGNGRLIIRAGDNAGSMTIRSNDGGRTWELRRDITNTDHMRRLSDGSYIGIGFGSLAVHHFDPKHQKKIPYIMKTLHAENYDALVAGDAQSAFCMPDIPDLAVGYGDSGDERNYHTGVVGSGIVELDDGSILIAMYGQFGEDKTRLPYFTKYNFYQYRTWVMISHDRGNTFEFLSTVADVQSQPIDTAAEGFCEPDLLYLGGGHVLCVMRTQGHEVYSPMYASHSYDSGRTWSPVSKVEDFGVLPRLLKMKNGAVVLASGKWDTLLKISADDGESWSDRIIVKENRGQWDRGPSGYTSIFETADDELLIVYDHTDDPVSDDIKYGERRVIYADRFRITAEK